MDDSFDMMVIGAGPAGEKAAAQAAFYGKRVAVVDRPQAQGGRRSAAPGADADAAGDRQLADRVPQA